VAVEKGFKFPFLNHFLRLVVSFEDTSADVFFALSPVGAILSLLNTTFKII
jgi:hypothetical protein